MHDKYAKDIEHLKRKVDSEPSMTKRHRYQKQLDLLTSTEEAYRNAKNKSKESR